VSFLYLWRAGQPIENDNIAFVHFVRLPDSDNSEGIRFQQDHKPAVATSLWRAGTVYIDGPYDLTVPAGIADGDYDWFTGLYTRDAGRLPIAVGDDNDRIRLGTLHVAGDNVTFTPEPPRARTANDRVNVGDPVLDFGDVRTNGCVRVRRSLSGWTLTPFLATASTAVRLNGARFGRPTKVTTKNPAAVVSVKANADGWWTLSMTGATEYHW
jgi:hypothetical protein